MGDIDIDDHFSETNTDPRLAAKTFADFRRSSPDPPRQPFNRNRHYIGDPGEPENSTRQETFASPTIEPHVGAIKIEVDCDDPPTSYSTQPDTTSSDKTNSANVGGEDVRSGRRGRVRHSSDTGQDESGLDGRSNDDSSDRMPAHPPYYRNRFSQSAHRERVENSSEKMQSDPPSYRLRIDPGRRSDESLNSRTNGDTYDSPTRLEENVVSDELTGMLAVVPHCRSGGGDRVPTDNIPGAVERKLSELLDMYKANSKLTRRSILLSIHLKEQELRATGIDPSLIKDE